MERRSGTRTGFIKLPGLSKEKILWDFGEHRTERVPQAVVNETDVRAPALVTLDLMRLALAGRRFPEDFQIHVVIAEVADRLSQLARSDESRKRPEAGDR